MNNLFVNCNNCGEKLQIEDGIMFTTCQTCHSTLEIVRTFNSVYTKATEEVPTEIIPETALKPVELDRDDIYKQIELLDREWQNTLPTFMVKGSLPDLSEDKFNPIVLIPIIMMIFGIYKFALFITGTVFAIVLRVTLFSDNNSNKKTYKTAKTKYEQKRAELIKLLSE